MASRRWLVSAVVLALAAGPVAAQDKGKGKNPYEEMFKSARRELPDGNTEQFNKMRIGNVALAPPSDVDRTILENEARKTIYQITHFELYTPADTDRAELVPRPDEKTVSKVMSELRGKLVIVTPGVNIADPQVDFAREFGAAAVKAIDEVLAKATQPAIRANAFRALAVVAESGAPAATDRVIALFEQLAKQSDVRTYPVEALYYGLQAAQNAIAKYDPARSTADKKWVSKDKYFALVSLVDDVVQKVPPAVAERTHQSDASTGGVLATEAKDPPKEAPKSAALTPAQVATVQFFRLQAIRALAAVKTDVVYDSNKEKSRATVLTLARVAVADPSVVPPPSLREIGEAVVGLVNATPTHEDLDGTVLGAAIARGVSLFVADKGTAEKGEGVTQVTHWKLYGARMKAALNAWDATVNGRQAKLSQEDRKQLSELAQVAITNVFEPLSKQSDTGGVSGLDKDKVESWVTARTPALEAKVTDKDKELKALRVPLFKNKADSKLSLKN